MTRSSVFRNLPHLLAAAILFFFAASHAATLFVPSVEDGLRNLVFPFLTNRQVYLFAAALQLACAWISIRWRGQKLPSAILLALVGTMLWYRWALIWNGYVESCGCLGVLPRLFPVGRQLDRLIPSVALALMVLCALPALFRQGEEHSSRASHAPLSPSGHG
ncbi:hypothetical protein [Limisphaera sp. VF-2]|uniref:hypothetical protein n=1 Tax=Limisphaera sp. VF-2 TaxID=3400418 RepID=UPI003C18E3E6